MCWLSVNLYGKAQSETVGRNYLIGWGLEYTG